MRNINLLPRIPFIKKHFRLLMLSIAAATIVGASTIAGGSMLLQQSDEDRLLEIAAVQAEANDWRARKAPDPRMNDYVAYKQLADELRAVQFDWSRYVRELSIPLPDDAQVLTVEADAEGVMTASYRFATMPEATRYIAAMKRHADLHKLEVIRLEKKEEFVPIALDEPEPTAQPVRAERYYEEAMSRVGEPEDEHDALLGELGWLIEQRFAQEQMGVSLPDLSYEFPSSSDWRAQLDEEDRAALTDEEYEAAKRTWEARKQAAADTSETDPQAGPESGAQPDETLTMNYYELTLAFTWNGTAAVSQAGGGVR